MHSNAGVAPRNYQTLCAKRWSGCIVDYTASETDKGTWTVIIGTISLGLFGLILHLYAGA